MKTLDINKRQNDKTPLSSACISFFLSETSTSEPPPPPLATPTDIHQGDKGGGGTNNQ